MGSKYEARLTGRTAHGNMAEWLRRLIRNQLEAIPREFESLCCRFYRAFFYLPRPARATRGRLGLAVLKCEVLVAQWIAHQTSNLGVAGSNPVEHVFQ